MKPWLLLLLGVAMLLTVSAPARGQYIFMDVNGDGVCDQEGPLNDAVTAVDIWLDTNHNKAGDTVVCSDGVSPLDMFDYNIIVHASGPGTVSFSGWTNAMPTWTALEAFRTNGTDASVGFIAPGAAVAPGKYKLGSFNITVTGTPGLSFLTDNSTLGSGVPITGFGSDCSGQDVAFTIVYGTDFTDACWVNIPDDVAPTTWGAIKTLYR